MSCWLSLQFLETTFYILIVLLHNLYTLHILTAYTLLLSFLVCKYFFFYFFCMCPQLVAKTKYIDTLIKLLLTYLLDWGNILSWLPLMLHMLSCYCHCHYTIFPQCETLSNARCWWGGINVFFPFKFFPCSKKVSAPLTP